MNWRRVQKQLLRRRKVPTPATPTYKGSRCWEFDGCRNPEGYGKIRLTDLEADGSPKPSWIEYAHRASAAAFLGYDLNSADVVAHLCENECCFNPRHLKPKPQSENIAEGNTHATYNTLSAGDVDALRRYVRRHNGSANLAKFAASRGVRYAAVRNAALGITHPLVASPQMLLPLGTKMARPVPQLAKRKPFERVKDDIPF